MKAQLLLCGSLFFFSVANAQNVGIGTDTPSDAKLEIIASSGNQLVSRTDATGAGLSFSIINNKPTVGFNGMGRLTNAYSYLGAGYAGFIEYTPGTGTFNFFTADNTGAANADLSGSTSSIFSVNRLGYLGIGQANPLDGIHLKGKNIRIDNLSDARSMMLVSGDNGRAGGEIRMFSNGSNDSTLIIKGSNTTGTSGEILFVNNSTSVRAMELSGDYNSSGRSRIIVDELQIKGGADLAEYFDVTAEPETQIVPGMLVSIDENSTGKLAVSNTAYDKKVAGVISGANGINPGMLMSHKNTIADGSFPVAINGRIYVWADASNGAINPGDQLTTSDVPGHAMKATNRKRSAGAIIGKSMSKLSSGKGLVLVLIGTR